MKKIVLLLVIISSSLQSRSVLAQTGELSGRISLSGAFALYPLAVKWAEEFRKIHPNVKIDISGGGAGKGMTDALAKVVDIGMVSRAVYPEEIKNGAWAIPVAKDAVVPTINAKNPKIKELLAKGITRQTAIKLYITGEYKTWGQVLGVKSDIPVRLFNRSDACGAGETWAAYLGNKKQEDLLGIAVFGDPGVASAVQRDPLGLGYNNIAYAYNLKTKKTNPGILVLPIDVNENGKIDPEENFYATSTQLVAAIAQGKYPSPPARDLYFVTNGKPTNAAVVAFLKFILTEGQKYNVPNGYIALSKEKLSKSLAGLK